MKINDGGGGDDDLSRLQNFCPTLNWGAKPKSGGLGIANPAAA